MSPMPQAPPLIEDPVRIEICGTPDDLYRHAASFIVGSASRALGARSSFHLAVSGDEALWPLWDLLPQPHFAYQIVWPAVSLYRLDAAGSARLDALRAAVKIPEANDYPWASTSAKGMPRFDLALVAMDRDGGLGRAALPIEHLNQSATICVLVTGESCAEAARRVLSADARPEGLPAQALRPPSGRILWLLDQPAASQVGVGS